MTTGTRYFVITSLLVLTVGLGAGTVAYLGGFPTSAFSQQGGPDELKFVPADASLVAFADVQHIMTSGLRQKLRAALPMKKEDGHQQFQSHTGINIETDIDRVVAFVAPVHESSSSQFNGSALVIARGRFDAVKIESLMREHGAQVEDYQGRRLLVGIGHGGQAAMSLAFLEPGLIAVGASQLVQKAVDARDGGASILTNGEMMNFVDDLDSGNAWAAGRFDVLASHARIPDGVREKLPPVSWFSASTRVDDGLSAVLRAETMDEESANSLRDVIRGGLALAKLRASSRPELQQLTESIRLGGSERAVSLSFDLPAQVLDALGAFASQHHRGAKALVPSRP
ncbi:MAG: hypothetical protein GEU82_07525 [Luteitalea sp.]|nr:hypothetical protein [Luteitalea sp.]